ncbi:metallophosphoesterase family protein [Glutamicibacter creatinolyticus]|uniref:metallophosphoesterase family protein n=1 Tax=Glutamicibacter creatinolyticus TaxID=162496 RepID=UPI0031D2895C
MRIAEDAQLLKAFAAGHVHGGDCIEWNTPTPEDGSYIAFRNRVMQNGLPYLDVPGNHDMCTYAAPTTRTANQWASTVAGRPQANSVKRMGGMAVIGLAPDYWLWDTGIDNYAPPPPLSASTLTWLSNQLDLLGSTPTWLVTHHLPVGQPAEPIAANELVQPWDTIVDIMASHGNVIGWLSGHWHIRPETWSIGTKILNAGGRKIFGINAPSASGITGGTSATDHQWKNNARSTFITYMGDAVDIRWRDHTNPSWMTVNGEQVHQLLLT